MSFLKLLDLEDDCIDTVATVVRDWCDAHQVAVHSRRGRDAMEEAIRLSIQGERSDLAHKLGLHMHVEQYGDFAG